MVYNVKIWGILSKIHPPKLRKEVLSMKSKKAVLILLTLLMVTALILTGCSQARGEYGSFTADTLDGGTFKGGDIAAKDLTVINFWGTFCSPCIAEMPDLAAFEKSLPDNVQLITICVDAHGNEETARYLLDQAGYTGITLTAGDESFNSILNGIQAVPTTVFVGPDGSQIGEEIIGMQPDLESAYLSAINSCLKELGKGEISIEK